MARSELRKWMDENGKKAVDVASEAHLSIRTVERFLAGHTHPSPLVVEAIERLIAKKDQ